MTMEVQCDCSRVGRFAIGVPEAGREVEMGAEVDMACDRTLDRGLHLGIVYCRVFNYIFAGLRLAYVNRCINDHPNLNCWCLTCSSWWYAVSSLQ